MEWLKGGTRAMTRESWYQKAVKAAAETSRWAPPPVGDWVYFIEERRDHRGGVVKIGRARNIAARIRGMQISNSSELRLLAWTAGGHDVEQCLHGTLALYWVRGEWFQGCNMVWDIAGAMHGRKHVDWAWTKNEIASLGLSTTHVEQYRLESERMALVTGSADILPFPPRR